MTSAINELEDAIADWEDAVKRIAQGWFSIDDYRFDLDSRECLQLLLNKLALGGYVVPQNFAEQIARIDQDFIDVTVNSDFCAEHSRQKQGYRSQSCIDITDAATRDRNYFWYFYRWPRNCPYISGDDNAT